MAVTAVTPSGVRDGDPAALAGLCDRRGPAVLAYCRELAGDAAATAAAAEAFARFRAAVVAADDPRALNPEALLLSATRHAAVRHSRGPAAGLCADVPRLLAARADRSISLADLERLEAHLVMCTPCRAPMERFQIAERAYRDPPRGAVTSEQSAVIVAALAAAAPVRSIVPRRALPEAPAVIPAAPTRAAEDREPQPTVHDEPPARDIEPPAVEDEPVLDAEPTVEEQPSAEPEPATPAVAASDEQPADEPVPVAAEPAGDERRRVIDADPVIHAEPTVERATAGAEPEPVTHAEPIADEQPAEIDAKPGIGEQPAAVQPEPAAVQPEPAAVQPEPAAVQPEPAAVQPEPAADAEPAIDEQPAASEPEPVADAEPSPGPQPVAAAHAEHTPDATHAGGARDDEPPTLEPAPAADPERARATGDEPPVSQPAFAASASASHEADDRPGTAEPPFGGPVSPVRAAGGDRPALELAPLTAAARQGAGHLSPPPAPEPVRQAPVVDAPTTEYRVTDDFALNPDLPSEPGSETTNGDGATAPTAAGAGGFGRRLRSPLSGASRTPAMRRAGTRQRTSGDTHLPRPQRAAAAANPARTSGPGLRPSIVLPVAVVALSLVVALFVAGVFASDDPASEAGTTVPGAPPATATTTPEIVIVPGARTASAAEVERAKARARAQRRRAATLGGAPDEPDSERASAPVRDEGGAVVDASPAPSDAPPGAADDSPPAADRPRDDAGDTGVDADNDSTGAERLPPSQDTSTVPDLAPPAEPVTPP